jgi:hypothetical protein
MSAFHQGFEFCTGETPAPFLTPANASIIFNVTNINGTAPTPQTAALNLAANNVGGCLVANSGNGAGVGGNATFNRYPGISVLPNAVGNFATQILPEPGTPNGSLNNDIGIIRIQIEPNALPGTRWFTYRSSVGRSNSIEFTVTGQPVLSSITPGFGVPGTSIPVTLVGSGFTAPVTVNAPFGLDFTLAGINVAGTAITGTMDIDPGLPLGAHQVFVSSLNGTTGSIPFNVISAGTPTISSLVPDKAGVGTTTVVAVTGSNFIRGATTFSGVGTGITVNDVKIFDSTAAQITLNIGSAVPLGVRSINVSTTSGVNGELILFSPSGVDFTVLPPRPTLTSVSPAIGPQGGKVPVTLVGTNFGSGLGAAFGTGLTIAVKADTTAISPLLDVVPSNVIVQSSTSATAILTIGTGNLATPGPKALTVRTESGSSNSVPFTLEIPAPPAMTSITPNTGPMGASFPVTIKGNNFVAGIAGTSGVSVRIGAEIDTRINVTSAQIVDVTTVTALFNTSIAGLPGPRNVVIITNTGGTSSSLPFTLTAPAPTLTSITPASGSPGSTIPITFSGTNFNPDSLRLVGNPDLILAIKAVSTGGTSAIGTLAIAANASPGARGLQLITVGGTSDLQTFTVLGSPPSITSVFPSSGVRGNAITVTVEGVNFDGGAFAVTVTEGAVTACRVVSSELNHPELEGRICARVRGFRFPARDVAAVTTTKPIDFFPQA